MFSNQKIYIIISSNFKCLGDSLMTLMNKDVDETEYRNLVRKIKKYKKSLIRASNLLNIILFYFFS
jgi:hypothetical protein